jgi:hypothetical protein
MYFKTYTAEELVLKKIQRLEDCNWWNEGNKTFNYWFELQETDENDEVLKYDIKNIELEIKDYFPEEIETFVDKVELIKTPTANYIKIVVAYNNVIGSNSSIVFDVLSDLDNISSFHEDIDYIVCCNILD